MDYGVNVDIRLLVHSLSSALSSLRELGDVIVGLMNRLLAYPLSPALKCRGVWRAHNILDCMYAGPECLVAGYP